MRVGSTHNPVQSFHRGDIFDGSRHYFLRQVYFFELRAAGVMFFTFLDKVYPGLLVGRGGLVPCGRGLCTSCVCCMCMCPGAGMRDYVCVCVSLGRGGMNEEVCRHHRRVRRRKLPERSHF